MSSTNFVDQQTVVVASWLNDVNDAVYSAIGNGTNAPSSPADVRTNLGINTTGTAILKGNGSGGFANTTSGVDYAPATSGSSLLKGDGAGGFSNAASGTDYAPATSGSSILKGNGSGGFSSATAGTDYAAVGTASTWTASQRGTVTTDNDLSFDMSVTNNFKCVPTGTGALTFTNITAGQSGYVLLVNSSGYAITAAATTKVGASMLSNISSAGTYLLSYMTDGTNVYVTASGALT